jgi:DNA-binding MarR family transcriptional regulator
LTATYQHDEAAARELAQLLGRVTRGLVRERRDVPGPLREAFARGSLGPRHMPVLFAVARGGPATVGELAARLALARPTVSLLVNELSRAGLVERAEDERDRRRTIVSVPPEHRRRLVRLAEARLDLVRRTLARLEPHERDGFLQGLRVLAEESAAPGREAAP